MSSLPAAPATHSTEDDPLALRIDSLEAQEHTVSGMLQRMQLRHNATSAELTVTQKIAPQPLADVSLRITNLEATVITQCADLLRVQRSHRQNIDGTQPVSPSASEISHRKIVGAYAVNLTYDPENKGSYHAGQLWKTSLVESGKALVQEQQTRFQSLASYQEFLRLDLLHHGLLNQPNECTASVHAGTIARLVFDKRNS